jgi:CBS domain containing-hemolysin-like protein
MTAADGWMLGVSALFLAVAGVAAAAHTALSLVARRRLWTTPPSPSWSARRLEALLDDPGRSLNALLFARTLAELAATTLVAVVAARHLHHAWQAALLAIAVMTALSFVVIGTAARNVGARHALSVSTALAGPASLLSSLAGAPTRGLAWVGGWLTPGRAGRDSPLTSEEELRELVDLAEQGRVIERGEREMIHSVFELGDTHVREVMVPRTDVVWIEGGKTVRQGMSLALRSGFSRLPVVGANEDDIIGVAYLKDLARRVYEDENRAEKVDQVMRPAHFVPDSKPADELLREMQAKQVHVAIVIDEYGGTAGLVTIEDILEEIVGEIADEYDRELPRVEELDDGAVRVNVRVPIDDLEEMFGVHFELEDVETVGGLMASSLGRVPIPGASVTLEGLTLLAEGAKGRRNQIGTVLIRRDDAQPARPRRQRSRS